MLIPGRRHAAAAQPHAASAGEPRAAGRTSAGGWRRTAQAQAARTRVGGGDASAWCS